MRLRQWRFGQIGEFTDAGDRRAAVCDIGGAPIPHVVDPLGYEIDRLPETAMGLNLLEVRPGLRSKGFGECLDVP